MLKDSMNTAISSLELPKPTKRVRKLLDRSAKELAAEFARLMKKRTQRSGKLIEPLVTWIMC